MSSGILYNHPNSLTNMTDGDPIEHLPVDQSPLNPMDVQIIDTLFTKHRKTMDIMFEEAKDALIVALLVIVVCLPRVDTIFRKFIPVTENSPYILLLLKGLLSAAIFWIVKYFYLSRKSVT